MEDCGVTYKLQTNPQDSSSTQLQDKQVVSHPVSQSHLECPSDIGTGRADQFCWVVVITSRGLLSTACFSAIVCLVCGVVCGVCVRE